MKKNSKKDTNEFRHEITLRGNQLITDFGKTTNIIQRDEYLLLQAQTRLESVTQQMMRNGIEAYINIGVQFNNLDLFGFGYLALRDRI